jgi:hypothetical protein
MSHIDARRVGLALVACLLVLSGLAWAAPAQAASFGGQAFSAYVLVPGVGPLSLADTGALPSNGGVSDASLHGAMVSAVLNAETLVAVTTGGVTDTTVGDGPDPLSGISLAPIPSFI